MTDLSLYKVDLDTAQPNGRKGESPRSAFSKYNDLVEQIENGVTGQYVGVNEPAAPFAFLEWIDSSTSPALIKRRNASNTAWNVIGSIDQKIGTAAGASLPSGVTELKNTVGIETTQTASASKIPQANASGKLADDWLAKTAMADAVALVSGGRNILRKDSFGNAQLVCRIPLCTYEDLNVPNCPFTGVVDAFRRQDGTLRPYVDICVHEASNSGGKAVSQAGLDPWTSINTDTSRSRCEELGDSWHMAGAYERALLGWIMLSKNFQPRGNTEYGRAYDAVNEFGMRQDGLVPNDRAGTARVLTGSGPDTWRHDGTPFGVSNWVGNVWERDEGWKMVNGQFYVSEYLGQPEAEWIATGRYINSGHVFSMTAPPAAVASNQVWGSLTKSSDYEGHELLQRLLIEPIDCTKSLKGRFYYNTDGERCPVRGGSWYSASNAGPAALNCSDPRSYASSIIGFRPSFAS